jgi:hypothetical protein
MTKTEQKLIDRMNANSVGRTTVIFGHTRAAKTRAYGDRDRKAAESLVEKGVARVFDIHRGVEHVTQWKTDYYVNITIELV